MSMKFEPRRYVQFLEDSNFCERISETKEDAAPGLCCALSTDVLPSKNHLSVQLRNYTKFILSNM